MKKSLIALAVLAASGAAMAQSSVTLSGLVETGLEKRFSGDATKMTSNRNSTSNWTLSGAEDLGAGLKAVYKISTSFTTDDGVLGGLSTGTTGSALGNNDMYVGLTGDFGTLRAGRPVNTLYGNVAFANGTKGVSGHDTNTVLSTFLANAGNSVYVNNAVQYHSPSFGGVQVQAEFAPSELVGASAGVGLAVRYTEGPIFASLVSYKGAGTATLLKPKSVTQLAGSYDFGVAKVLFTYRDDGNFASTGDNGYALGVTAPVGPGSVYFSHNVREVVGTDKTSWIAGYKYNFSKRTQAFVNLAGSNKALNVSGTGKSSTGYGFGLQTTF